MFQYLLSTIVLDFMGFTDDRCRGRGVAVAFSVIKAVSKRRALSNKEAKQKKEKEKKKRNEL